MPKGEHYMNIWQGDFPLKNSEEDGYGSTGLIFNIKNIVLTSLFLTSDDPLVP